MALFHTTVLDNQIKALDTIGSVSGAICTFDTDRAERLVKCVCEVASGSSNVSIFVNSINLWNERWELGTIDPSTGENQASTQNIRSIDFIYCQPSKQYFFVTSNGSFVVFFYDQNKQLLQYNSANNSSLTTPNNCYYIRFRTSVSYGTTYNNDLGVNISTDYMTYQPFKGVNVDLGETLSGNGSFDVLSGILTRSNDTTKHVDGNIITAQVGTNNIYADTGDIIDLKFVLSVGKAIS